MLKENEIQVNGVIYVKKSCKNQKEYVVVRTYSAGCFAGHLDSYEGDGTQLILLSARRLWYWDGASSLSQLAMEGVKKPENCKFPQEVERIRLNGVIEVIDATEQCRLSISGVPEWRQ